jgi:hypothetical protein
MLAQLRGTPYVGGDLAPGRIEKITLRSPVLPITLEVLEVHFLVPRYKTRDAVQF